jgi:hypothetical protein
MAIYTATFTLIGNDLGNLPSYYDTYVYDINGSYQYIGSGGGGIAQPTFIEWLDYYTNNLSSTLNGTVTYTLDGPGTWNAGVDTFVTITYTNTNYLGYDAFPYWIQLSTEDYQYFFNIQKVTAPAIPTICNTCQLIQLTQCGDDNFYLDLGLADGSYTAYYTDNTSGVVWEQGTNSNDSLGGLLVYQWFATAGMFNQYSFYTMTLRDSNGDAVSWVVNDVEYTCATLTFKVTVNVTD